LSNLVFGTDKNPLWGAPRIHGELLKLGFEIAESTVSKYLIRHRGPVAALQHRDRESRTAAAVATSAGLADDIGCMKKVLVAAVGNDEAEDAAGFALRPSDPYFSRAYRCCVSSIVSASCLTPREARRTVGQQHKLKDGTLGFVRGNPQPAIMGLNDRTADRQTHPHTA
jgi:hypothetical protein